MESITLETVGGIIAFLVAFISGISFLLTNIKKFIADTMKDQMNDINQKMDTQTNNVNQKFADLNVKLDKVDVESCKNFLVTFLSNVEKNGWADEVEKERFWEEFEYYQNHGGNSYIKRKVDELKEKKVL